MKALHMLARAVMAARIDRMRYVLGSVLVGTAGGFATLWVILNHSDLTKLMECGGDIASLEFMTETGRTLLFVIGATVSACSLMLTVCRGRDIGLASGWLAAIVVVPWSVALLLPTSLGGILMAMAAVELIYLALARGRRPVAALETQASA